MKMVESVSLETKINLHEIPVSQALRGVLGAQGPLLFLCLLVLQLVHNHQAPPVSVIDREKERWTTTKTE